MSRLWPTFSLSNRLDSTLVSHDQAAVDAYKQDPNVHDRITARWVTACMAAMATVNDVPERVQGPLLVQVAGADRLVSAPATLAYFDRLTAADKTLHLYEKLYHEIYNEQRPDREKVLGDLSQWLAERFL